MLFVLSEIHCRWQEIFGTSNSLLSNDFHCKKIEVNLQEGQTNEIQWVLLQPILFQGTMKKVLAEHYSTRYAAEVMRASKLVYRKLVAEMDNIGSRNSMGYNAMFAAQRPTGVVTL